MATLFLDGKSQALLGDLKESMDSASADLDFEEAARLRDQIQHLRKVQEEQYVDTASGDVDAFGIALNEKTVCIQGLFIRDGRILGHRTWLHKNELGGSCSNLLSQFLGQYYIGEGRKDLPRTVLTFEDFEDREPLAKALSETAGRMIEVTAQVRTTRAKWQSLVQENAELALATHVQKESTELERMLDLQQVLDLDEMPKRLECFDVSHTQGEATVASCVVFETSVPSRSEYRRYNISNVGLGDDYGAIAQAVERRYRRILSGEGKLPDILIVDGGLGQLNKVHETLSNLMEEEIHILGISKGEGRRPNFDSVWKVGTDKLDIRPSSPAMHLLQNIRDEAHRFAIEGHRKGRQRVRRKSLLNDVPGIGAKRKRDLLSHFGSAASIKSANIEEIAKVPGIGKKLASEIYGVLHGS